MNQHLSAYSKPTLVALPLALAVFFIPLVAYVRPRAVVPIIVVAALFSLIAAIRRKEMPAIPAGLAGLVGPLLWLLVLFCALAGFSIFWALDFDLALRGAAKLAGNITVGMILLSVVIRLHAEEAALIAKAFAAGFGMSILLLLVDAGTGGWISLEFRGLRPSNSGYFWLNSNAAILTMLVWPLAMLFASQGKKILIAAAFGLLVVTAALLEYATGVIAVAGGVAVALGVYLCRKHTSRIFAALVAAGVLLAPMVPGKILDPVSIGNIESFPNAAAHRLYIWEFAADKIIEKPLAGWGMNGSRALPSGKGRAVHPVRGDMGHIMPLHPHNFALQVWLELGLPGAVLLAAFLALLILRLNRPDMDKLHSALFTGQLAAGVVLIGFGVGIWQSWVMATFWLSAALGAMMQKRPPQNVSAPGLAAD